MENNLVATTKRLSLFVVLFINVKTFAQYNLVSNPSFEDYISCPISYSSPPPKKWIMPTNYDIDYYNSCSPNFGYSVPINHWGDNYQSALTGNAYIAVVVLNAPPINARTYYQTKLKDSLKKDKSYYVEFFVVSQNDKNLKCNNISALLSKTGVRVDTVATPFGVLNANPQITNYGNPIINDTLNWVKVSGIYKADGGEQYLTLGNFKDDAHTSYFASQPTGYNGAAIMIDDVSVIPLDSMCLKADAGKDTAITLGDSVFIGSYTNGIDSVLWFNASGQVIDSVQPGFWVKPSSNTFYVLHQVINGCFSSDTVYINVVLPLRFISYALRQAQGDKVENIWTTANEINVSHFNIQRSINGKDFITIGTQKAQNKSYNEYSFIDEQAFDGVNYYRIVGVDNDGKMNYSEVKSVSINEKKRYAIFPNPARDFVNISCVGMKEINIINGLGQTVIHQTINNNTYKCNIQLLPKGLYLLNIITTKNYVYNEKIIVQ